MFDRVNKRLSNWKLKLLSIGGRLTLVKSVLGSLGIYYMSMFRMPVAVGEKLEKIRSRFFWGMEEEDKKIHWVKWKVILNDFEHGGLKVGSLGALNQALMYKWRWRFETGGDVLWCRLIRSCYGQYGGFRSPARGIHGVWEAVNKVVQKLHDDDCIPFSSIHKVVGNGMDTKFWLDLWCGDRVLADQFPRLYAMVEDRDALI